MSLKNLMMLVLSVSLVTAVALTGGCVQVQIIEDITPQEAFTLIQNNQNNPDFVIIDVRTPQEFAEEHIENALNIDYYSETFRDELNKLDKNKTYLVEAYNILGGINQWKAEGFELKTEGAKSQTDVLEWKREEIPTQMK